MIKLCPKIVVKDYREGVWNDWNPKRSTGTPIIITRSGAERMENVGGYGKNISENWIVLLKREMEGWPHRMLKYFNLDCPQPCGWKENGKILFGKSINYALSAIRE